MIGVDTNLLVRYLTEDDAEQTASAVRLLEGLTPEAPGFIGREVALELVWVLERSYGFSSGQIAATLGQLLLSGDVVIEQAGAVSEALRAYRTGGTDFADLMIRAAARRAGCTTLYTFDRRAARLEGTTLL
ncbi:PIN domain-containing protein [soil metagenome]